MHISSTQQASIQCLTGQFFHLSGKKQADWRTINHSTSPWQYPSCTNISPPPLSLSLPWQALVEIHLINQYSQNHKDHIWLSEPHTANFSNLPFGRRCLQNVSNVLLLFQTKYREKTFDLDDIQIYSTWKTFKHILIENNYYRDM